MIGNTKMIEAILLLGLGAVGYVLAANPPEKEDFTSEPRPTEHHTDEVHHSQQKAGHGNQVPFFGARVTQSMYSGGTNTILDNHTGAGKEYFQKRETKSFFDVKPGGGNPFGQPVETDFEQSRMVTGMNMKNVFPIQQVQVGPGANDGYTNIPKGGYQQDSMREFALPKTTDELRVVSKPKLTYELEPVPGASKVTNAGIQAPVNKNRPDKFAVIGMDRANTAVGAQVAQAMYPDQLIKEQARETTGVEYFGSGGGREGFWASYIRAFTEPYQEFMKLTAEGRPNPGGLQGSARSIGGDMYSTQTKKDESVLSDATRLNVPQQIMGAASEHLGSFRYNEPLQQDIHTARNDSYVLDAYKNNPYTQPLNSI
jgi:hypothetical protein